LFFKARAEKGIAGHIDASSVVWTLIDKGKLTNQIATLTAIVLKREMIGYYQGSLHAGGLDGQKNGNS